MSLGKNDEGRRAHTINNTPRKQMIFIREREPNRTLRSLESHCTAVPQAVVQVNFRGTAAPRWCLLRGYPAVVPSSSRAGRAPSKRHKPTVVIDETKIKVQKVRYYLWAAIDTSNKSCSACSPRRREMVAARVASSDVCWKRARTHRQWCWTKDRGIRGRSAAGAVGGNG